jgi:endonuclease/exonuclease/phosphatase family metal-dependent hydrolase
MPITVVSWNIQKGIGMDFRANLARTADVLASLAPDVVGLQEVIRAPGKDQAAELADRLDMRLAWGPARSTLGTGTYGNALLVRGEIEDVAVHDLSVRQREPRSCLDASVRVRGAALRVFVCHFGLGWHERSLQAARLGHLLRQGSTAIPRVVMGDFNEWREGPVSRVLQAALSHVPERRATHPSAFPFLALDRMAWDAPLSGPLAVVPVRSASDHRALQATLELS